MVVHDQQVAAAHHAAATGPDNLGAGTQHRSEGRAQVVDGEPGGEHPGADHGSRCEGQRVVGRIAQDSAVHEAVLLEQVLPDVHLQRRLSVPEGRQAGTEQCAEGLGLQHLLGKSQVSFTHGASPHPLSRVK